MTFEMLDGMLTALVIGPAIVPPSEYMPEIWGTDNDTGPEWNSIEQVQYFMNLLMKHWNAIAARRNADAPHDPFIIEFGDAERGQAWGMGFMVGVELGQTSWDPLFRDNARPRSARRSSRLFGTTRSCSGTAWRRRYALKSWSSCLSSFRSSPRIGVILSGGCPLKSPFDQRRSAETSHVLAARPRNTRNLAVVIRHLLH